MRPITLHQRQTFHIHILRAKPPRSRLLSTLGGLVNSPIWTLSLGRFNWFQAFCCGTTVVRDIALRVHSTRTVASAAERNWSVFRFIHSKSRNRLYCHKGETPVYIYQNMRLLTKIRDPAFKEPCVLPDYLFDEEDETEE